MSDSSLTSNLGDPAESATPRDAQQALLRLTQVAKQDLQRSGLALQDIGAESVTSQIAAELGIPYGLFQDGTVSGYVLPYFNVAGDRVPFYRVRLFLGGGDSSTELTIKRHISAKTPSFQQLLRRFPDFPDLPKYLQPGRSSTYVYFPKNFTHAAISGRQVVQLAAPDVMPQKGPLSFVPRAAYELQNEDICRGYILITEGEKKAACAVKYGFPCVGLGGVDNWRATRLVLPHGTIVQQQKVGRPSLDDDDNDTPDQKPIAKGGRLTVKLPKGAARRGEGTIEEETTTLAVGLEDIIYFALKEHLAVVICYDSDQQTSSVEGQALGSLANLKPEVQRAASALAYELRYRGLRSDRIKLMVLPLAADDLDDPDRLGTDGQQDINPKKRKMGLDDFLVRYGPEALEELLRECLQDPHAFPRHPNPKLVVNRALEAPFLHRKGLQQIASAILAELDARGKRLLDINSQEPYYFDNATCKLMAAPLDRKGGVPFHEQEFGQLLYRQYGISGFDRQLMPWMASQFTGEQPLGTCTPKQVVYVQDHEGVNIQLGDSFFATITPDSQQPIIIKTNGSDGIMFTTGAVEGIDVHKFAHEFDKQYSQYLRTGLFENWWQGPLKQSNIVQPDQKDLANLLFYVSPFLSRWRNVQLPVELYYGEPNSGKSSLLALRLLITTGRVALRNMPNDLRDWYASITSTGGLFVIDNANLRNPELRQAVSDEMCRIITSPEPTVELRKLYTTATIQRMPVNTVFAYTAITPQFKALDLLQRAVVLEFFALAPEAHDSDWVLRHLLARGGREAWIANQCLFLHLFLKAAGPEGLHDDGDSLWAHQLSSQHRLAHFERVLYVAAHIIQQGDQSIETVNAYMKTIHQTLQRQQEEMQVSTDWVLEGLREFARNWPLRKPFTASDVSDFAGAHESESLQRNSILTDVRRLARYMTQNKGNLNNLLHIQYLGLKNQRQAYTVTARPSVPIQVTELEPESRLDNAYVAVPEQSSDTVNLGDVHLSKFASDIADDDADGE